MIRTKICKLLDQKRCKIQNCQILPPGVHIAGHVGLVADGLDLLGPHQRVPSSSTHWQSPHRARLGRSNSIPLIVSKCNLLAGYLSIGQIFVAESVQTEHRGWLAGLALPLAGMGVGGPLGNHRSSKQKFAFPNMSGDADVCTGLLASLVALCRSLRSSPDNSRRCSLLPQRHALLSFHAVSLFSSFKSSLMIFY